MAGTTRLELATSCVTGMRSNQTELRSHLIRIIIIIAKFLIAIPFLNSESENIQTRYFIIVCFKFINNRNLIPDRHAPANIPSFLLMLNS